MCMSPAHSFHDACDWKVLWFCPLSIISFLGWGLPSYLAFCAYFDANQKGFTNIRNAQNSHEISASLTTVTWKQKKQIVKLHCPVWNIHPSASVAALSAEQSRESGRLRMCPWWHQCWVQDPDCSTGFTGDTPVYRACYGACLCCHCTNAADSCSACDPDSFLRNCYLAISSPSSLCRRLIPPQSRSLLLSLLNWTLFFFQTISQAI